ncbi:MAG TPA: DUF2378 family protein [Candidatus Thermoplasmatota archaeon]|nr:DUF2378 family protein [Candidatus Thermoplasmatota archaeon]
MRPPTIKGIFVQSHVGAIRSQRGEEGVLELERRYGAPVRFRGGDDVPVREEVRLLEAAVDVLCPGSPAGTRAFEAGRLHFRNFRATPWARLVFGIFPAGYHFVLMHASSIAERVFQGLTFEAEDLGPTTVRVTMTGSDYPLDHFRGLFYEWMVQSGLQGTVIGQETAPGRHEYLCQWRDP